MPVTAIDDGFPGRAGRLHFYEILGAIVVFGALLMTYWYIFD